jgi:ABC-type bacteriocin/lantibiotic exporter with double-glycine peptidase domain
MKLAFFLSVVVIATGSRSLGQSPNRSLLCGPKCINNVLMHYGQEARDVLEVTKYLSKFDSQRGSRLDEVEKYLNDAGVFTRMIMIDKGAQLAWHSPAIVHLESSTSWNHFVVWYPQDRQLANQVKIFDGSSDWRLLSKSKWNGMRSGVVLLTSPVPIPSDIHPIRSSLPGQEGPQSVILPTLVFLLGVSTVYAAVSIKRRVRNEN